MPPIASNRPFQSPPLWPTKNLHNLLVSTQLKSTNSEPHHGSSPWQPTVPHLPGHLYTFVGTTTGHPFHVRATATSIYLIECRKCKKQYVGETQNPLPQRTPQWHQEPITWDMGPWWHQEQYNRETNLAAHFNIPGHSLSGLTILVIENKRSWDPDLRKKRENYWIHPEVTCTRRSQSGSLASCSNRTSKHHHLCPQEQHADWFLHYCTQLGCQTIIVYAM